MAPNHLEWLSLSSPAGSPVAFSLLLGPHGEASEHLLIVSGLGNLEIVTATAIPGPEAGVPRVLARLRVVPPTSAYRSPALVVASFSVDLLVDGARPLGLKVLGPGSLVSAAGRDALLVFRSFPTPGPAPADIASKPCPVCGIALAAAPVVACPGCSSAWFHLEDPAGDADSRLNCFTVDGACAACGLPRRLEETVRPDPVSMGFALPRLEEVSP